MCFFLYFSMLMCYYVSRILRLWAYAQNDKVIWEERKMKMKKLLALFLACFMVFGLTACGGEKDDASKNETERIDGDDFFWPCSL